MTEIGFNAPPEPTDWCNVRFSVKLAQRREPIEIWLGWENDLGVDPKDLGDEDTAQAFKHVDDYRHQHPIIVYRLLEQARIMYLAAGANDVVGEIPELRIIKFKTHNKELQLEFSEHSSVVSVVHGTLTSSLAWRCSNHEPRIWSTARHAAIGFALSHLDMLDAHGFSTVQLRNE
jgi:hypothetical protein